MRISDWSSDVCSSDLVEFPDVMAKGGFDLVIGNPPWERVEVQEQELFSASHPQIANAPNAAKRKRMIQELEASDPRAYASWQQALRTAATEVAFYKEDRKSTRLNSSQ